MRMWGSDVKWLERTFMRTYIPGLVRENFGDHQGLICGKQVSAAYVWFVLSAVAMGISMSLLGYLKLDWNGECK